MIWLNATGCVGVTEFMFGFAVKVWLLAVAVTAAVPLANAGPPGMMLLDPMAGVSGVFGAGGLKVSCPVASKNEVQVAGSASGCTANCCVV